MILKKAIEAPKGAIAKTVLLPGDPLRTKYIAETFLDDPICYNESHGLLGYTGHYQGIPVSIQTTGMGTSSVSECVLQLIEEYGCENLIRVGSCASHDASVHVGDLILSMASHNESNLGSSLSRYDYVPTSSFDLLKLAYDAAKRLDVKVHVGVTGSCDTLYREPDKFPLIGSEMEGTGMLITASEFSHVRAFLMMTCGAHSIYKDEVIPAVKRSQSVYDEMITVALEVAYELGVED